ncbi:MAG: hypothetical protein QXH54_00025 [Methanothermobacter sp.]
MVIGCDDRHGKATAETYLAGHGINCYAPFDKFTTDIMPHKGPHHYPGQYPHDKILPLKNETIMGPTSKF